MAEKRISAASLLEFFELEPFVRRWEKYNFADEELGNLQIEIISAPKHHPVIKGTRGIRKMRYSPVSWSKGKSGALRVCYVYFERLSVVVLVIVYAKNEMDDISESMKSLLNDAIVEIEKSLEQLFTQRKPNGK